MYGSLGVIKRISIHRIDEVTRAGGGEGTEAFRWRKAEVRYSTNT
jgi:hypothetical protein